MSNQLYHIETRSRSRSKTPLGMTETAKEKKSLTAPNIQTIVEEHVEVSSSSLNSGVTTVDVVAAGGNKLHNEDKLVTIGLTKQSPQMKKRFTPSVDKATINISGRNSANIEQRPSSSTTTTAVTKVNKTVVGRSSISSASGGFIYGLSTSTPKSSWINTDEQFATQMTYGNVASIDPDKEASQISRKSFDISNIDISKHPAYLEYKKAGEYWNNTPKTDYTYSQISKCRREIAPGVIAMPNMSRYGLQNHMHRVSDAGSPNPANEEFIRRRFKTNYNAERLIYDSSDEVDRRTYRKDVEQSWFLRIITTIKTIMSSMSRAITGASRDQHMNSYYTVYGRQQQIQHNLHGTIPYGIGNGSLAICRYIYMFISSALCLDTILLRSSSADNRGKKRFLLLLLVLLPLLLLGAWYLLDENERLEYWQKTQTLLPLSLLSGVRSSLYASSVAFKGLLHLPSLSFNWYFEKNTPVDEKSAIQHNLYNIEQNMKKSLTPEEYKNILNHIHNYVQQVVDLKLVEEQQLRFTQSQALSAEQINLVVQLMRENLQIILNERQKNGFTSIYELNDTDIQRLADQVAMKLELSDWSTQRLRLTKENLAEIKKLIRQQIDVHNYDHYHFLGENLDLDSLLVRILSSEQLAKFVDARINVAIKDKLEKVFEGSGQHTESSILSQQQHLIDELNNEIASIKLTLSDKLTEKADLQHSINQLKNTQDNLLERMQQHKLATDKRFSGLLAEMEHKLTALNHTQFALLNKQIKLTLVEIFGFKESKGNVKLDDVDLHNWVGNLFVAKEYLEERLLELNNRSNNHIRDEIERSSLVLMHDINERLKNEIMLIIEAKQNERSNVAEGQMSAALTEKEVRKIVKSVLAVYDADKTGMVDYALESAGGQIISTRCTENFRIKSAQISIFGIPLWYPINTPRVVISPNVQPGECWAFQGFPGFLVIKLNWLVYVTGFTLEHIPKSLSINGRIDSAPRNFTVWGLEHENDQEPVLFGEYEYVDNGPSLQYFPVQNRTIIQPYQIVELRVESNHGQPTYTCLYRFRVHGKPTATT